MILSSSLQNQVLDRLLGGGALSVPATWLAGLFNGNPLSGGVEAAGSGYARVSRNNDAAAWRAASLGKANTAALTWPVAGAAWGDVDHVALYSGGGTHYMSVPANELLTVLSGDVYTITPESLNLSWRHVLGQDFSMTPALRNSILDALLGQNAVWSVPANWELSLWTADPIFGAAELSGIGYSRITVGNTGTQWSAASGGKTNLISLRWPAGGGAGGPWGTPAFIGFSSAAGFPPVFACRITSAAAIDNGRFLELPPGSLEAVWLW